MRRQKALLSGSQKSETMDFPQQFIMKNSNLKKNGKVSEHSYAQMGDFNIFWDFPGGPVVKNPPSNAGDVGLIPGQGTKIPHATGQLSPRTTTTEPTRHH